MEATPQSVSMGHTAGATARRSRRSLSDLDVTVLQVVTKLGLARGAHLSAWTGASPWTIRARLRGLADRGLVQEVVACVDVWDPATSRLRSTVVHCWECTSRGSRLAGEWTVVGYDGLRTGLTAASRSRSLAQHVLGAADLACWYRRYGFAVVTEREVRSLEGRGMPGTGRVRVTRPGSGTWSVDVLGRPDPHPADLGAVHPDGSRWAIELERATKTVSEYAAVISAYQGAALGQVWHILSGATTKRVVAAAQQCGVTWAPENAPGTLRSIDGQFRIHRWLPARALSSGPASWAAKDGWPAFLPRVPPAGFGGVDARGLSPIDVESLRSAWIIGRTIDIEAEIEDLGGWLAA